MVGALADAARSTLGAGTDTLQHSAAIYHNGLDIDIAIVKFLALVRVLSFSVGDCAAEKLLQTT